MEYDCNLSIKNKNQDATQHPVGRVGEPQDIFVQSIIN